MTDPKFPYGYDVEPYIQKAQDAPDPQLAYKPVETAQGDFGRFLGQYCALVPGRAFYLHKEDLEADQGLKRFLGGNHGCSEPCAQARHEHRWLH